MIGITLGKELGTKETRRLSRMRYPGERRRRKDKENPPITTSVGQALEVLL